MRRAVCREQIVGRTADTIGLGITNKDARGYLRSGVVAICPSVRPTDRRTPSVYLPRNFSRYQVRRGFASPSPGEAASHSGKRELPSLTPSLPRSLAPGQSLGAQLKLDESWKLHGLHLINDAARPPQCTRSRQNTHCTVTWGGREGAGRALVASGVEGIVG